MSRLPMIYGTTLVLLGCWASFTTWKLFARRGGRARYRRLIVIGIVFAASCLLPGVSLLSGAFEAWMLIPLGACYWTLIPHPCYFDWANQGWIHRGRTVLFVLVGAGFIAAGFGWLSLAWFGL